MSVLSIVQDAMSEMGFDSPTLAIGSADTLVLQFLALFKASGAELVKAHPWQILVREHTFSTTGAATYELPSDYARGVPMTHWDRTTDWQVFGDTSAAGWAWLQGANVTTGPRIRYRVKGGVFAIYPSSSTGATFAFEYIANTWLTDSTGVTYKSSPTADGDLPLFDQRLLIADTKLRFAKAKGFDYAALQDDVDRLMSFARGQDVPMPDLAIGGTHNSPLIGVQNAPDGGFGA